MPDQKISVDPAAADLSGCIIPVVTGGINKQAAASLFGITGVANGVIYSAGNRNTSDPTNFNYVPGTQTLTVVGPIRTSPVTNEATVATPANGMIIYSTALSKFRAYENGAWVNLIGGATPAWLLASGGTLTGVNTITSNAKNQLNFTGTWTATAAADAHIAFGGTLTAASGLGVTGYLFNPTLNAVGTSSVQVGLDVNPTFAGGTTPVNITARFQNGGVIIGNFSGFPIPSSSDMLLIRNDQGGTTRVGIINNTSGTTAKATINVSTSSSYAAGTFIHGISAGFVTSGMYIASTGVLESTYTGGLNVGTSSASQLGFWTNNTERARFLSTGEFSIGSTSVGAKVYINQSGLSSGWIPTLRIDPGPHTSLTAATEFKDYVFNTRTATWLAGTTATQRFAHFQGQTVAGASVSATFTDLYTVFIDPSIQGSQAIITNNWALGVGGAMSVGSVGTDGKISLRRSSDAAIVGYIASNGSGVDFANGSNGTGAGGFRFQMASGTALFLSTNTANLLLGSNASDLAKLYVLQSALTTTGGLPAIRVDGGAHTNLTASVEVLFANFNSSATVQYATGSQAILRNILVQAPTIGFVGASTITDNATFTISGAPKAGTNTTQTNTHGLLIQAGAVTSAGSAFGLTVNAPTGGTLNYAAQTKGGSFLFAAGTTTYAPIIIPTGTNLTTSAAGALENDGTHLWFTFANSGARWQLDNQVGTFGWALAGNTLVADGIIGDVGTGGFKISLYTNNTARQVISSKGNFTFTQDAQSVTNTFIAFNQAAHTGGEPSGIIYTGGSHTGITPSSNFTDILFNAGGGISTQFVTGNLSLRSMFQISGARLISFVGASTITDAAAVDIFGSPQAHTNATFTNVHALLIRAAATVSAGAASNSYGLTVNAQTGATNNYTAKFLGGNVGIGLSAPLSTLDVSGSIGSNTRTITTSATLAATDHTVLCDSTGGVVAATLPTASGAKGRIYVVKKIDASANNVTLATVDGGTKTITTRYSGFAVQSDGSLWYVIASF